MIAVIGYSRFPVFYSMDGKRVLGHKCDDNKFCDFVYALKDTGVVIKEIGNVHYRSRFVIRRIAVNPATHQIEDVPERLYFYPDDAPDIVMDDIYAWGIMLRGFKRNLFLPLICIRKLSRKESNAVYGIFTMREINIDKIESFLDELGIEIEEKVELPSRRVRLKLNDPAVSNPYVVEVDSNGVVHDVNICLDFPGRLYLPELIMLTRETREIYVYHIP